jgi:hypothetical protein
MNETIGIYLCILVGAMEALGCFALLMSGQAITRNARFGGTDAERWSMIRRLIYWGAAVALAARATYRFDSIRPIDAIDAATQIYIVFFIVVFPTLRALKLITQDRLIDGDIDPGQRGRVGLT